MKGFSSHIFKYYRKF